MIIIALPSMSAVFPFSNLSKAASKVLSPEIILSLMMPFRDLSMNPLSSISDTVLSRPLIEPPRARFLYSRSYDNHGIAGELFNNNSMTNIVRTAL